MKAEFTAIIEVAPEGGYWAICPEVCLSLADSSAGKSIRKQLAANRVAGGV